MSPLSRLLVRLLVAGLGFSAALVAGLLVGLAASVHRIVEADGGGHLAVAAGVANGGGLLSLFTAIVWPGWAAAVVLGEITATRSLFVHLVVATLISVVGVMGGMAWLGVETISICAAIGLSAGFVHWLVAGRTAGLRAPRRLAGAPRPLHDAPAEKPISEEDRTP